MMSLESAIAVVTGQVALHQMPRAAPVAGIAFVVAAGIGADAAAPATATPELRARAGPYDPTR